MGFGAYLAGVVVLTAEVGSVGLLAVTLRRRYWGNERSAQARLVAVAIGLALVSAAALVLGTVGLLRAVPVVLIGGSLGMALAIDPGLFTRRRWEGRVARSCAPSDRTSVAVAVASAFALVSVWIAHTVRSYQVGMLDGDTLWYHLPFAARYVQEGSITAPHPVNGDPLVAFFPANNEVLHALAMLPFDRDLASPLVNLVWLAIALLAGWCLGSRQGRGPLGLTGAVFALSLPIISYTQAGSGRNDLAGVALLLVAAALFADRDDGGRRQVTLALASAMLGLAVGVKVSLLLPAGLLFGGGAVVLWLDHRRSQDQVAPGRLTAAVWAGPAVAFGAYWYVRNWVAVGNPLPWLGLKVGPLGFEAAPLPDGTVSDSSVVDRLTETGGWADVVRPGLRYGFGAGWPLVVAAAVALVVGATVLGRRRLAGMLTVVAGIGLVAYLFSPNTAPEPTGIPFAAEIFVLNARYVVPALVLAVAALVAACADQSRHERAELGVVMALGALTVLELAQTELNGTFEWRIGWGDVVVGAVIAGVAAAAVAYVKLVGLPVRPPPLAVVVAVAVVLAAAFPLANRYLDGRYSGEAPFAAAELWPVGDELHGERIALAGDFFQYPYVGADLSNRVQFVGVDGPHGGFRQARTCGEWRRALADEDATVALITPQLFTGADADRGPAAWTRSLPDAIEITPPGAPAGSAVYQLGDAPIDDRGC